MVSLWGKNYYDPHFTNEETKVEELSEWVGPDTAWAAWHPRLLHLTALLHLNLKLQASFQSVAMWLIEYVPPMCLVHCLK